MSKPVADKSNFVAIGVWNPAILQPNWLRKQFHDLVPEKVDLAIPVGGSGSLQLGFNGIRFIPLSDRLEIIPEKLDVSTIEYIQKLVVGISGKLPHTPLVACGYNFSFELGDGEVFVDDKSVNFEEQTKHYKDLFDKEMTRRSITHTFSMEQKNLNINFLIDGTSRKIRFNWDYSGNDAILKNAAAGMKEDFLMSEKWLEGLIEKVEEA